MGCVDLQQLHTRKCIRRVDHSHADDLYHTPPVGCGHLKELSCLTSDGKLCTRRDRRNCPFHGPVVPRDDSGMPIDPTPGA